MKPSSLKRTAVACAVAGTISAASPASEADVINLSWSGAFTILLSAGVPYPNSPSDYKGLSTTAYRNGYYANGGAGFGVALVCLAILFGQGRRHKLPMGAFLAFPEGRRLWASCLAV